MFVKLSAFEVLLECQNKYISKRKTTYAVPFSIVILRIVHQGHWEFHFQSVNGQNFHGCLSSLWLSAYLFSNRFINHKQMIGIWPTPFGLSECLYWCWTPTTATALLAPRPSTELHISQYFWFINHNYKLWPHTYDLMWLITMLIFIITLPKPYQTHVNEKYVVAFSI